MSSWNKVYIELFPKGKNRSRNTIVITHGMSKIIGGYTKANMERVAVNILKALKSKKLKQ